MIYRDEPKNFSSFTETALDPKLEKQGMNLSRVYEEYTGETDKFGRCIFEDHQSKCRYVYYAEIKSGKTYVTLLPAEAKQ